MEDELDNLDQPEDGDSASNTPAKTEPDLEALVRSVLGDTIKSELDSRFSGLQSMQDKRLAQLAKELKASSLTEEQQESLIEQEQAQDTAKALQIAELIKRRKTAPEAVDFLLESMDKSDLDEQLSYIQSVLGTKARQSVESAVENASPKGGEAAGTADVPDQDKNNPRSSRSISMESDDEMNEELADSVLNQVGRGQFGRFFGRR